jgi:hypothetical protein
MLAISLFLLLMIALARNARRILESARPTFFQRPFHPELNKRCVLLIPRVILAGLRLVG